jgi:hypothetical protein
MRLNATRTKAFSSRKHLLEHRQYIGKKTAVPKGSMYEYEYQDNIDCTLPNATNMRDGKKAEGTKIVIPI